MTSDSPAVTKPIAFGADEAGAALKNVIMEQLRSNGYAVKDFGVGEADTVDYPDVAFEVAEAVARGEHDRAILVCGTGLGMAIAANKVKGVRAATAHDPYSAERARMSNDAQILTMGGRVIGPELAKVVVAAFMGADFGGGNSARKVAKIDHYEAVVA